MHAININELFLGKDYILVLKDCFVYGIEKEKKPLQHKEEEKVIDAEMIQIILAA